MSYEAPRMPAFEVVPTEREFDIDELDEVTIAVAVTSDEGERVPAGSVGTVVAVWREAQAFEVEFDEPFHALATVEAFEIGHSRRTD